MDNQRMDVKFTWPCCPGFVVYQGINLWFPDQLPELYVPMWHFRTGSVPELHSSDTEMHRAVVEWPSILLMIPFTNIYLSLIPRNILKLPWCFILASVSMCSEWHSTQGCCEQMWNVGNYISAVGDCWLIYPSIPLKHVHCSSIMCHYSRRCSRPAVNTRTKETQISAFRMLALVKDER